ncbi:MAG: Bug family tripartite tricarboxylate transporter substrate binding protein [Burkholderiales bacterium]
MHMKSNLKQQALAELPGVNRAVLACKMAGAGALALFFVAEAGLSHAQSWPAKPVRVIVSISTGSATDITARLFADSASKGLGQQFFVENVVGAAGSIGAQAAARATPDGYTLYVAPSSALASNPYMVKSLPYNPFKDFGAIGLLTDSSPLMVSVHPELPVNSIAELIAYAKANPGKLSYGLDASSGFQIVIGRMLKFRGGIDMVEVPYKSGAQGLSDAAAGRVQVALSSPAAALGLTKAGKLRILALTSERRFPGMESVATVWETFPGFKVDGWFALVGPAGMPGEMVRRANQEVAAFAAKPEIMQRLLGLGLSLGRNYSPEEAAKFIADEQLYWARVTKEVKFEPE